MQYCSLQHLILLSSPVTPITGFCFISGSVSLSFLDLFLHRSPVAYWAPTDLWSLSFSVLSFCLFLLFMGFSRQGYWSGLPFPSPVDHVLSELSAMTRLSWWPYMSWLIVSLSQTRLWSMWSDWLVFCDCGLHSVCPLMEMDKRLTEASWWEGLTERENRFCSDGWGQAQWIFNPIFCWWAVLCSLPVISPGAKLWQR